MHDGERAAPLDFYHAAHNLWKGAAAWLDGRTTQARRWFGWARHRLRHGRPDGVLADLAEALDVEELPDTARATLTTVHAYLERHREHIDYAAYKELGLPLGSGMVESACKWLSQGLPQTGVRQYEIVVNMVERQLLAQARLPLAQRAGTPSNRRDVLTQTEVEALHQGGVDVPTQRTQYLIDGLERAGLRQ